MLWLQTKTNIILTKDTLQLLNLSITQLPITVFAITEHKDEYHRSTSYLNRRQWDYSYCQGQE
jgi:hypothetical protein